MKKLNLKLLAYLQDRKHSWRHPQRIMLDLKMPQRKFLADLGLIKEYGFPIVENPHLGYQLEEEPIPLVEDIIRKDLKTSLIGNKIRIFKSVTSTMDAGRRISAAGRREDGSAVFAEVQTEGRGRFRREWKSEKEKDLLFSVVLFPEAGTLVQLITVSASVAVAECLKDKIGVTAKIKFPNDIMMRGKKVAGILVEKGNRGAYVLGIGLNVNEAEPPVAGATSLRIEKKQILDRNALARDMLGCLDRWYGKAQAGAIEEIDRALACFSSLCGKRITVHREGKNFTGKVASVSAREGLKLVTPAGKTLTFKAEHVTLAD